MAPRRIPKLLAIAALALVGVKVLLQPSRDGVNKTQEPARLSQFTDVGVTEEKPLGRADQAGRFHFEKTADGKFCVFENFFGHSNRSNPSEEEETITFVTQGSIKYLKNLAPLFRTWNGKISMALYLTYLQTADNLAYAHEYLSALAECNPNFGERVRVSVFLSTAVKRPCPSFHLPPLLPDGDATPDPDLFAQNATDSSEEDQLSSKDGELCSQQHLDSLSPFQTEAEDKVLGHLYPVNAARNLAKKRSTGLILIADSELFPSDKFAELFLEFHSRWRKKAMREAFVIPVFEVESGERLPGTKGQLRRLFQRKKAIWFHYKVARAFHRYPRHKQWMWAGEEGKISLHATVEYQSVNWEPVILADAPLIPNYDERFTGYARNKVQQVYEMCKLGFTFHAINGAFLSHSGIKRSIHLEGHRKLKAARNNRLYKKFRREMNKKYGMKGGKC